MFNLFYYNDNYTVIFTSYQWAAERIHLSLIMVPPHVRPKRTADGYLSCIGFETSSLGGDVVSAKALTAMSGLLSKPEIKIAFGLVYVSLSFIKTCFFISCAVCIFYLTGEKPVL